MSESLEKIKKLIEGCSREEQLSLNLYLRKLVPHSLEDEWGIDANTILSAIKRSSDLTKRGVRGIIAEAVFVSEVVPLLAASGWEAEVIRKDESYDALLRRRNLSARIQVKLQRLEAGKPKLFYPKHYEKSSRYVVEVQRTRTGLRPGKKNPEIRFPKLTSTESIPIQTRPYLFGDFDILAVNMHPSSGDWRSFRYTVASWLLPRPNEPEKIAILQPVDVRVSQVWTDSLATCLQWFASGEKRRVLDNLLHVERHTRR